MIKHDITNMMQYEVADTVVYMDDDGEAFFDADGHLMGYISNRGPQYIVTCETDDGDIVDRCSGNSNDDANEDQPLLALLEMHRRRL